MKGHSVGNIKRCEAGEREGRIEIIKGFTKAVKSKRGVFRSLSGLLAYVRNSRYGRGETSIQNVQVY